MADVTSEFGKRKKPCPDCSEYHNGIDLRAPIGSPIYANQDLKVSRIQDFGNTGYGKALYVKDPNDPSKEYIFGHLDDNNPGGYKVGSTIPAGALMGYSGATGVNEQAHVHYEVRKNGKPIPPRDEANIASFKQNSGNLLTTTAIPVKDRSKKPTSSTTAPSETALGDLAKAREREKNKIGPGSNPRPRANRSDVGIILNPRLNLGDGD
jgi:murein DD-endopeptidase MepM/ murein hydrolase activator NlpD